MTCTIKLRGPLPLAAPAGEAAAAALPAAGAASLRAGPDVATSAAVGLEGGVTKAAGAPCGVAGTEAVAADEWEGLPSASATMRPALRERMPLVNSRLNSDFLGCGLPASLPRLRAPSASPRPISRPAGVRSGGQLHPAGTGGHQPYCVHITATRICVGHAIHRHHCRHKRRQWPAAACSCAAAAVPAVPAVSEALLGSAPPVPGT